MAGQPLHYFQMWSLVRQSYNGGVTQAEAAKVGVPLRAIAASGNKANLIADLRKFVVEQAGATA